MMASEYCHESCSGVTCTPACVNDQCEATCHFADAANLGFQCSFIKAYLKREKSDPLTVTLTLHCSFL